MPRTATLWPLAYEYPAGPPARPVRRPAGVAAPAADVPSWIDSGTPGVAFDFCAHARRLCVDIAARCPELAHVDTSRLLLSVTQARGTTHHGLQARLTPLRFRGGAEVARRGGKAYRVQRYRVGGRDMLYLLSFCLPRFLDQGYDEKLITVFHELYHIGPSFEGDLRRMEGRCPLHSHSKRAYDAHMAALARAYLAGGPAHSLHGWLRLGFAQLVARHGAVLGATVPRPRLLPEWEGEAPAEPIDTRRSRSGL